MKSEVFSVKIDFQFKFHFVVRFQSRLCGEETINRRAITNTLLCGQTKTKTNKSIIRTKEQKSHKQTK